MQKRYQTSWDAYSNYCNFTSYFTFSLQVCWPSSFPVWRANVWNKKAFCSRYLKGDQHRGHEGHECLQSVHSVYIGPQCKTHRPHTLWNTNTQRGQTQLQGRLLQWLVFLQSQNNFWPGGAFRASWNKQTRLKVHLADLQDRQRHLWAANTNNFTHAYIFHTYTPSSHWTIMAKHS